MTPARLGWADLMTGRAAALCGRTIRVTGWLSRPDLAGKRVLVGEPPCCPGCLPGSAAARVGSFSVPAMSSSLA